MKYLLPVVMAVASLVLSAESRADLTAWQAGAVATGAGFTQLNITAPTTADIGTYDIFTNGGVSYEFIVNATELTNSNALIGARNTGVGDNAGIKYNQWQNTGTYGATLFGVADIDSAVANVLNEDVHLVFAADGSNMDLYVNGALQTTMTGASFTLSGEVGLGQAFDPGGSFDEFVGEIKGVAIYDGFATEAQAAASYANFTAPGAVPEPSSLLVLGGLGLVGLMRRKK